MRVRFAPSPTGKLHLGNIRTAVVNWLHAKASGGEFLLRMDDTDKERSTEAFAQSILRDLEWLQMPHDAFARQSDRMERYALAKEKLIEDGRLYPCYESADELALMRKSLVNRGKPPIYDRSALKLNATQRSALEAQGRTAHWRFLLVEGNINWDDMVRGSVKFDAQNLSDPVLFREDGRPLYTISSVVDDIELAVSDIIRGEDHVANTAVQVQLFEALDGTIPRFGHLPLITDATGEGLSKRIGSLGVEALQTEGYDPLAVNAYLAALGTPNAPRVVRSMLELAKGYDLGLYGRATPKASAQEIGALSIRYLHEKPFAAVCDKLPGFDEALWLALRDNIKNLEEAKEWLAIIRGSLKTPKEDPDLLAKAASLLPPLPWNQKTWGKWTSELKQASGRKGKALFLPLRLALTGRNQGPEMAMLLPLIDRESVLQRLQP